ncbi:Histone-lysine N-methyltransferase ATXR3 (Protein SET DOMAIN GROUP 2) (Trithorax-related protein 3) (TRX-related protein 3) [Durusdinium trenchii]|uniref:Histone-lysine N-methyltransferase ATXR3 (Protein SET DOMAIN GROUP 2) (Trithorax-related protein 3) (TRX-related protein 3) n=1 Tax=Durusdinium trenchii TaxID=1381693 RepID=A0ABP0SK93_9DINO
MNLGAGAEALCAVCLHGDDAADNQVLFCDACDQAMHQACYRVDSVPEGDWFCDSCTELLGSQGEALVVSRRVKSLTKSLRRECALCPNSVLQGGFLETDKGEWVHAPCALHNKLVMWPQGSRKVSIDAIPEEETRAWTCEICAKSGYRGCIECTGGCKTSFFHVTCAMIRGAKLGYGQDRCPSCYVQQEIAQQRKTFVDMLTQQLPAGETRTALQERTENGDFDRLPFKAALGELCSVEKHNDSNLVRIFQELSKTPGPRSAEDLGTFKSICDDLKGNKNFNSVIKRAYHTVLPEDKEKELAHDGAGEAPANGGDVAKKRAPQPDSTVSSFTRRRRKAKAPFPGFSDSPLLWFNLEGFANAVMRSSFPSQNGVAVDLAEFVRSCVRAAARLIERLFVRQTKERAERDFLLRQLRQADPSSLAELFGEGDNDGSGARKRKSKSKGGKKRKRAAGGPESSIEENPKEGEEQGDNTRLLEQTDDLRLGSAKDYSAFRVLGVQLEKNTREEPYLHGSWNKAPYSRRPYEEISEYAPTPGMSEKQQAEILQILQTSKKPECDQTDDCAKPVPYSIALSTFDTPLRCKSRRVGCPRSAVGRRKPVKLGQDVIVSDMWGLDCFTRRNMQSVMEIVCGIESKEVQRALIQKLLLPVIDLQPPHRAHNLLHTLQSILKAVGPPPASPEEASAPASSKQTQDTSDTSEAKKDGGKRSKKAKKQDDKKDSLQIESDYQPDDSPAVATAVARVVEQLVASGQSLGISVELIRNVAVYLLFALRNWGLNMFRIHPKGVGVQCSAAQGLPSGTFVTEYLGELFAPWRWFEKQDAIKNAQRKLNFKPVLPDFYNIMMERHGDDQEGFDLAYIDPIVRGNFASRLSHSCEPNCATVVMVVDGKYVVCVYTLREISFGEELTFDYSSVTEDENEFKAATCLCGSLRCRGSFLYYSGVGAFAQVISESHTFLHRNTAVYKACANPHMEPTDFARLHKHGIKQAVLRDGPTWIQKWISLLLEYAEFECRELAHRFALQTFKGRLVYTERDAELEARGVLSNRVQNIAITINKLRNFLNAERPLAAIQPSFATSAAPLVVLSDDEVVLRLWVASESTLRVTLDAILSHPAVIAKPDIKVQASQVLALHEGGHEMDRKAVRETLLQVRDLLWSMPEAGPMFVAAGDLLTWLAYTKHMFTSTAYPGTRSAPIGIRNVDIGRDGSVVGAIKKSSASKAKSKEYSEAERHKVTVKRVKTDGDREAWTAVKPVQAEKGQEDLADDASLVKSQRPPGPLLLPYWFDYDDHSGDVRLSACDASSFQVLEFRQDKNHRYLWSLRLEGEGGEDVKEDASTSESRASQAAATLLTVAVPSATRKPSKYKRIRVLRNPMPGAVAFYVFRPQRIVRGVPQPVKERSKGTLAVTRVVPDEPVLPPKIEGVRWVNMGLFYAFDVALPGTTEFCALDHENNLQSFFAFTDEFFRARLRFANAKETFLLSPSHAPPNQNGSPSFNADNAGASLSLSSSSSAAAQEQLHHSRQQPKKIPKAIDPLKVVFTEAKKYQSGYVWGHMSGWFKQTVASPDASLSAERRGTLSLPDIQSCFSGPSTTSYKDRQQIIERIQFSPDAMWPTGSHWSFKNKFKLYGSPWLDDVIEPGLDHVRKVVNDMEFHIRHKRPPPRK